MGTARTALLALCLLATVALLVVVVLYVVPNLNTVVGNVVAFVNSGIFGVQSVATAIVNGVGTALQGAQDFVLKIGTDLSNVIATNVTIAFNAIRSATDTVISSLVFVYNSIRDLVQSIQSTVTQIYDTFIAPIVSFFNGLFNELVTAANGIADLVTAIYNAFNNFPFLP